MREKPINTSHSINIRFKILQPKNQAIRQSYNGNIHIIDLLEFLFNGICLSEKIGTVNE